MTDSQTFPWYDGAWLNNYYIVKELLEKKHPEKVELFEKSMDRLRTSMDFRVVEIEKILDESTLDEARNLVKRFRSEQKDSLELHEINEFGRLVVHDHDFFNKLQAQLCSKVSAWVGEEVEPYYNFLSLYANSGVCPLHMDAPEAKWTVDICLDQSYDWPIKFSSILPWPSPEQDFSGDWQQKIIDDPDIEFTSYTLKPGNAIIFSGSSQYHYRESIQRGNKDDFCNLVFFHYIPKGSRQIIDQTLWSKIFDLPGLDDG